MYVKGIPVQSPSIIFLKKSVT